MAAIAAWLNYCNCCNCCDFCVTAITAIFTWLQLLQVLRALPAACRYWLHATPPKIVSFTKIMDNSTKNASIELAINDLNRQLILNFRGTAKKYGLVKSTLCQRFNGQTVLIKAARAATY